MSISGEIGSSGGINAEGGGRNVFIIYTQKQKKTNEKIKKLKTGEVVAGTVLDVYSDNEISVMLPNGTFRAELKCRLKKGDSLYFKVKSHEPALTLNIYGVATKKGKEAISSTELIRILDFPDTEPFRLISTFIVNHKNFIIRQQMLALYDMYSKLPKSEVGLREKDGVLFTLLMLEESHLTFTHELFKAAYLLFCSLSFISFSINYFIEKTEPIQLSNLNIPNEINWVFDIANKAVTEPFTDFEVKNNSEFLNSFLKSKNLWDTLSIGPGKMRYLLVPIFNEKMFKKKQNHPIILLEIISQGKENTLTENRRILDIYYAQEFAEYDYDIELCEKFIIELAEYLDSHKLEVRYLATDYAKRKCFPPNEMPGSQAAGMSVVV